MALDRRRFSALALLVLTALAAAGCGGSSAPKSASVPETTSTTTTATSHPPPVSTAAPPPTTTSATTTSSTSTATAPATTTTAPAPTTTTSTATTPLPTAPAGLAAATGYSSYDNCQGTCTGSVPASLRRALHLPGLGAGGACPVSGVAPVSYAGPAVGTGPVYAAQSTPFAITSFINSSWDGARVTWVANPSYTGPVLIRGGQVGGAGAVGFGEGHVPVDELQLLTAAGQSSGEPAGAREWPSFTRVRSAGCYAYQVDGTDFSRVIVFQATG
jgi:hypothetical protein